jgi:hypothetical protein
MNIRSLLAGMITVAAGWRAGPSGLLRGFMLVAIALTLLHPGSLTAAQPNQPAKALAQLQAACDKGDGQACYDLGTRYEQGDGVAKNADRAVTLYERSCEIGYAGNCWYLGTIYEDGGFGLVAPNVSRAAALYRKGCDRGDGNACFSLGLLYKAGKGVPRNPAAAAAFIRKGCVDLASGVCEDSGGLAVHMTGLGAMARPQASAPSSPTAPAPASRSVSPPQQASPSPSNQSLFSIFGVRLGADRYDAVKTMLDRNRADFFDYLDGTTALDDATRQVVARRLVVSDARFAGISARGTRVLFDFANEPDPILSTVTVFYGPGIAGLQAERVAALTRQFGVDDGNGNAAQWHRVVPGAEIALFADSQTGAVIERYVYSKEQPGAR